jgi:contact-dependent growth inhibition (CDI) system CdiI-like immunity protein
MSVRDKSLEELGAVPSTGLEGGSYLLSQLRRLRTLPLKQLRIEDIRLLIGQSLGLEFLVPIALDHLEAHPLAAGDFYPGDLLKNVMEAPEWFWDSHPELRDRLVNSLERALERVRKVNTIPELEGELKAGLKRHVAS